MNTYVIKYHRPSYDGVTVYDFEDKVMAQTYAEAVQMWLNVGYRELKDGTIYKPTHKEEWIYDFSKIK